MPLLPAVLSAAAVAAMAAPALADRQNERQLYTECRANGQFVHLGRQCCHQTSDIKFFVATSTSSDSFSGTCNQLELSDITNSFETYCGRTNDSDSAAGRQYYGEDDIVCTYDVKQYNSECADQKAQACEAAGGQLFESDLLLECGSQLPSVLIKNSLSCMGASCGQRDVQEYLWTAAPTFNHGGLETCTVKLVEGQTLQEYQREANWKVAAVVAVLVTSILIFGVGVNALAAIRHLKQRQKRKTVCLNDEMEVLENNVPGMIIPDNMNQFPSHVMIPYDESQFPSLDFGDSDVTSLEDPLQTLEPQYA